MVGLYIRAINGLYVGLKRVGLPSTHCLGTWTLKAVDTANLPTSEICRFFSDMKIRPSCP